jgi:hypothetical protein
VINPDTGKPILTSDDQLRLADFRKAKHAEMIAPDANGDRKGRKQFFSALWQADRERVQRAAPVEFMGRYMKRFFDYAIADEMHELANVTAQGQALGTMAAMARRTLALTGTYSTGYADNAFNNLFRLHPERMIAAGFDFSSAGLRAFAETYGVLEKITTIEPANNACSEARVTRQVKRRPGASPLLFGHFLMGSAAFLSLEDIAEALPPYQEEVLSVEMDPVLKQAYSKLEEDIKNALREFRGNASVLSVSMNALLLYPDRPFQMGDLMAYAINPDSGEREKILISSPADLDCEVVYAKERRLIDEVKAELERGRKCQIFAVWTQKRDVTQRLKQLLSLEGMQVEVLTTEVPPERREAWYEDKLRRGMQVCIAHPRLVITGLDYVEYEGGRELFFLKSVCFGSETNSSADTGLELLRVQRITVASLMSRQPFRARAALRTSAATSAIWLREMRRPHPPSSRTRSAICGHRGGSLGRTPRRHMQKARGGETRRQRIVPGRVGHEIRRGWVLDSATYARPREPRRRYKGRWFGTRTIARAHSLPPSRHIPPRYRPA